MPYWCVSVGRHFLDGDDVAADACRRPRSSAPAIRRLSMSGRITAKGSSPTISRAHQTAWPRPSGSCWRVKLVCAGFRQVALSASSSVLPRSASVSFELVGDVEMILDHRLVAAGDENEMLDAGRAASSTMCCITGRSTTLSISFGMALVAGRKRVPRPATGRTALRIRFIDRTTLEGIVGKDTGGGGDGAVKFSSASKARQAARFHRRLPREISPGPLLP